MECPPANHAQAAGSGNAAVPLLYQDRRRLDGGMHRGKPRSMLPGIAGYPKIGIRPDLPATPSVPRYYGAPCTQPCGGAHPPYPRAHP